MIDSNYPGLLMEDTSFNPVLPVEGIGEPTDPLALEIKDSELAEVIDRRVSKDQTFWKEKYHLFERRKRNERYLFGRQVDEKEENHDYKPYEAKYLDNALYEIEASLKPLAMSRLPDLMVMPGDDTEHAKQSAEDLSLIINDDINKRKNRIVLGIAFKHNPVYFTAIIKAVWNPQLGEDGDYEFVNVHPDNVLIDSSCPTNNADDMEIIPELVPMTIQDVIMRFPEKKDSFLKLMQEDGIIADAGQPSWKELATPIKIREVWFTWYKNSKGKVVDSKEDTINEPGVKWERIEGVCWKYKKLLLKKMKNPNFDYQGETKYFVYDSSEKGEERRPISEEDVLKALVSGQMPDMEKQHIYHNYFSMPHKPYFFMGYDQWGKVAVDETSRIEQNLRNQQNLDEQGKQIIDTLKSRVKHIFSKDSGLKSEDIERMDMNNPDLDLLVDDNVNDVHKAITPERPDSAQYKSLDDTRNRMYAVSGSNAIRGQLQTDVATSNQIAREADYTRADDLVEDTINAASEWMAMWALQFIKLRYTESHFRRILGAKGTATFVKINRDLIDDGVEVRIKSSGTDKLRIQRNAMEMAKLKLIDPLNFYKDMDMADPLGRTEMLLTFNTDPATYLTKYVLKLEDTGAQVDALKQGGAIPQEGEIVPQTPIESPQAPSVLDTTNIPTEVPRPEANPGMI